MEMNTRIQVEHPVTELVTGIDIIEEQINIASGHQLDLKQSNIKQLGHAIECRIYAEDPANNFQPSPGKMSLYTEPRIPGIRLDTGIVNATEIKSSFDPILCKLVVWGKDRDEASMIMVSSLQDYIIHGIKTNITFLTTLMQSEAFVSNAISTRFCDEHLQSLIKSMEAEKEKFPPEVPVAGYLLTSFNNSLTEVSDKSNIWQQIGYWRDLMKLRIKVDNRELTVIVNRVAKNACDLKILDEIFNCSIDSWQNGRLACTINGRDYVVYISEDKNNQGFVSVEGFLYSIKRADLLTETDSASSLDITGHDGGHITSPMPGKVTKINVNPGEVVKKGKVLLIIEAMKMENMITAPVDGIVKNVNVKLKQMIETSTALVDMDRSDQ